MKTIYILIIVQIFLVLQISLNCEESRPFLATGADKLAH